MTKVGIRIRFTYYIWYTPVNLSTNYQQTINIESVRNSYSLVIHLKNSSISQGIRVMFGILESINPYKGVETSRKLVINGAILQC